MPKALLDTKIQIETTAQPSRAIVAEGALANLPAYLGEEGLADKHIFVITDETVAKYYGDATTKVLTEAGITNHTLVITPGEETKNLAQIAKLWESLTGLGALRGDVVVALGGGVVGDMAGFVAATYKRGMPVVQIPTSLTAIIDSAIGGKTGFDHAGKNNIGAFHLPRFTLADPVVLETLGRRQYTEGFGEIIKTGILEPSLLPVLEDNAEALTQFSKQSLPLLSQVIVDCIKYKVGVIEDDPQERKPAGRVLLNYGHTLAHALEAATGYKELLHGEAVAIGIEFALQLSRQLGILEDGGLGARQTALLERFGLPTHYTGNVDIGDIMREMGADKKNVANDTTRFVLPVRPGQMSVQQVDNQTVTEAVRRFLQKD